MKLTFLKLRDRLDNPSVLVLKSDNWDMSLEQGIVTVRSRNVDQPDEFLIPLSNVAYARPERVAKK